MIVHRLSALFATLAIATLAITACAHAPDTAATDDTMTDRTIRIASYNVSLYDEDTGGLIRRLELGNAQARRIAAVVQVVRPDIVLLNEFDYDEAGRAADLFQHDYLEQPQPGGGDALRYPYRYFAPVNTGVQSGLDLDNNGSIGGDGRDRGNDAWGYGLHPGQYGMLLLSKFPIDAAQARTFQLLKWSDMPGARRPVDPATGQPFHADAVWSQLRLSSKSHWDVPVETPLGTVHILASHPTPPTFDGPENRNGLRNHDEIRLWREYITPGVLPPGTKPWLCDDNGTCGGLADGALFAILGDLNNDPVDGDGEHEAIVELLEHPRVLRHATPRSEGAIASAEAEGSANLQHRSAHAHDTANLNPRVGNLRLDYALPSVGFTPTGSGVFWPKRGEPGSELVDASDHRLVWVDVATPSVR